MDTPTGTHDRNGVRCSATYSPDDNKLRLYASSRLDAETYAKVKAAGFRWAPKQELFVAPAWTPEREDLALELAGEIDDDDTSLTERAEERAERFEDYTEKRTRDAESAAAAVRRIADGIPFGQPILVGHHSERHARKDAERIENGMRRAVKMWETANYWTDRAEGAIRHAKYKERPDVRARRIKGIESDRRKILKNIKRAETWLKVWADPVAHLKSKDGAHPTLKEAVIYFANHDGGNYRRSYTHASGYVGPLGLWEAAGGGTDYTTGEPREPIATPEEVSAQAIRNHEGYLAHARRWLAHYDNRLAYERAMLGEAGGIEADKTKPEKGGGCRCWASPGRFDGGWSYIVKVNQVSVTVYDNWGNGGNHFTRTIPFDKLTGVMSRAEVEAARAEGRILDTRADATGKVEGFFLKPAPTPEPEQSPILAAVIDRSESIAEAEDDDGNYPGELTESSDEETQRFPAVTRDEIDNMRATLKAGVTVAVVPDLFPTPRELARRMVDLAAIEPGHRVLEPSAGTGNIVHAIFDAAPVTVVAIEANARVLDAARAQWRTWNNSRIDWRTADFLSCNGDLGTFDRIVMNPPFTNGVDIKHIEHARHMLRPGGRLVALCANGPRQREKLQPLADTWEDLPDGSFSDAGTNVRVALLTIEAPDSIEEAAAPEPQMRLL